MTEPKTPQEWNEAVAKALGLDVIKSGRNAGLIYWRGKNHEAFKPWTDPAAALWVMERFCKERKRAAALRLSGDDHPEWSCTLGWGEGWNFFYALMPEAICRMIVEATG